MLYLRICQYNLYKGHNTTMSRPIPNCIIVVSKLCIKLYNTTTGYLMCCAPSFFEHTVIVNNNNMLSIEHPIIIMCSFAKNLDKNLEDVIDILTRHGYYLNNLYVYSTNYYGRLFVSAYHIWRNNWLKNNENTVYVKIGATSIAIIMETLNKNDTHHHTIDVVKPLESFEIEYSKAINDDYAGNGGALFRDYFNPMSKDDTTHSSSSFFSEFNAWLLACTDTIVKKIKEYYMVPTTLDIGISSDRNRNEPPIRLAIVLCGGGAAYFYLKFREVVPSCNVIIDYLPYGYEFKNLEFTISNPGCHGNHPILSRIMSTVAPPQQQSPPIPPPLLNDFFIREDNLYCGRIYIKKDIVIHLLDHIYNNKDLKFTMSLEVYRARADVAVIDTDLHKQTIDNLLPYKQFNIFLEFHRKYFDDLRMAFNPSHIIPLPNEQTPHIVCILTPIMTITEGFWLSLNNTSTTSKYIKKYKVTAQPLQRAKVY